MFNQKPQRNIQQFHVTLRTSRRIRSFEWYKISSREIQEKVSKIYFHQNIKK